VGRRHDGQEVDLRFALIDAQEYWAEEHARLAAGIDDRITESAKLPTRISNSWFIRALGITPAKWLSFRTTGLCTPEFWWDLRKLLGLRISPHLDAKSWVSDEIGQIRRALVARNGTIGNIRDNYSIPMSNLRRMYDTGGSTAVEFIEFLVMGGDELPAYIAHDVVRSAKAPPDAICEPSLRRVSVPRGLARQTFNAGHLRVWMAVAGYAGDFRRTNARGLSAIMPMSKEHILLILTDLARAKLIIPTGVGEVPTVVTHFTAAPPSEED
jgi:hypothetical protein